jgi:hypothetical protein
MSIHQMDQVWKHSQTKGSALLLLLAIADNANDYGFAWPGIVYLAKKTRMSVRQTLRLVQEIETQFSDELLVNHGGQGTHDVNRYAVIVGLTAAERHGVKIRFKQWSKGDKMTPILKGDAKTPKRDKKASKGDKSAPKGDIAVSPEPSLTPDQPSKESKLRERDPLFDAIVFVTQVDPKTCGASIGKVKQVLLKVDPPYTAADVLSFGVWHNSDPWRKKNGPPSLWTLREKIGIVRFGETAEIPPAQPGSLIEAVDALASARDRPAGRRNGDAR